MKQVLFLGCILFLFLLLLFLFAQSVYAGQTEFKFAYVGETEHSAYSGVELGLNEANL